MRIIRFIRYLQSCESRKDRRLLWHVWGRGDMCTGFWWGGQQDREHLEDPGVDWNIRKWDVGTWIGSIGAG